MSFHSDNLDEWLRFQGGLNAQRIDLGLQRLRPVADRLHLCGAGKPLIAVAGTNGKGSTVAMIEALLRAHERRSASYTSPWLLRFNESVRCNAEPVCDAVLIEAFERVERARDDVPLTEFEFRTLAAALIAFGGDADVVVLEVGLGGRLDAVNLFDANVAIITSIGLDHQQWLGDTLAQIAREKAGIARRNAPLICADVDSCALLEPLASEVGARAVRAQTEYRFAAHDAHSWWYEGADFAAQRLPRPALPGEHQLANAAAAITAVARLFPGLLSVRAVAQALAEVTLAGRVQRLGDAPLRYVDVAHNPQAAQALARWTRSIAAAPVAACCAMYADKDLAGTVGAMAACVAEWHVAALSPPRGASGSQLAAAIRTVDPDARISVHERVEQAWLAACARSAGASTGSDFNSGLHSGTDVGTDSGGGPAPAMVLGFGSFETVGAIVRLESALNRPDTSA